MCSIVLRSLVVVYVYYLRTVESTKIWENNCCSIIQAYYIADISPNCSYNEDVLSNVPQMCKNHGYNLETFPLTTTDGYMLNVFKVTSNSVNITQPPVLILHGVTINSGSWTSGNISSIVFHLVDLGYEVYVGNPRGTPYSNKHVNLTVDDPEYWNFNLDTLNSIDIRDQIIFVTNKTNKKIIYLGHSMGTTLIYMYCSEHYEEASKLLLGVVTWAPVAYFQGTIFEALAPIGIPLFDVLITLQVTGLFYQEDLIHELFTTLCRTLPQTCYSLFSIVPGPTHQFPPEDLLTFTSYWPSGTSVRVLKHFLQLAFSKRFQKYDYGEQGNQERYGTLEPPTYNLSNIQLPISLLYGDNDIFYGKESVERLFSEIGSTNKNKFSVPVNRSQEDKFCHLDFIYSVNIIKYLYELTVSQMTSFSP